MNQTDRNKQKESKPGFWSRERYSQILALMLVLGISFLLLLHRDKVIELGSYSYLGAFLISMITCASIIVPLPGLVLVTILGAILNPFWVGIASGLGGTIGEMTGYGLGYGGRLAVEHIGFYSRTVGWMKKWGGILIFLLALIPNPLFDVAGATAGLLRFPLWKFVVYGAAGRIPKHILFAYLGTWGIPYLPFLSMSGFLGGIVSLLLNDLS